MWRGRSSIPHMFESHHVSDVSHRRGGCQKTSAHRVARRSGRCRSSLASGSVFACGGMCGPWGGTGLPHVPFVLLRAHVPYVRTIRYMYKWFTDESGTIWLKIMHCLGVRAWAEQATKGTEIKICHVVVGLTYVCAD